MDSDFWLALLPEGALAVVLLNLQTDGEGEQVTVRRQGSRLLS